jgi:hypothetical protein
LIDFFDQNMLQLIDVERFLIAWVTAPKRKTLYALLDDPGGGGYYL